MPSYFSFFCKWLAFLFLFFQSESLKEIFLSLKSSIFTRIYFKVNFCQHVEGFFNIYKTKPLFISGMLS